jgi:sugar (pentulose or hexulose) kinase
MRIGMGGSAASSMATGANAAELDFDSVQRGNPEIERRAQEVINQCWMQGPHNPILAIHDVGAGGLSNAFPELTNDAGRGARFDLRSVKLEESGMAPKEIRLTGGGSKSAVWRQIAADAFNAEVVTLSTAEGAALGGAIQAAYAQAGGKVSYDQLCKKLVKRDEKTRCKPNKKNATLCAAQLERQMELTGRLEQAGWL